MTDSNIFWNSVQNDGDPLVKLFPASNHREYLHVSIDLPLWLTHLYPWMSWNLWVFQNVFVSFSAFCALLLQNFPAGLFLLNLVALLWFRAQLLLLVTYYLPFFSFFYESLDVTQNVAQSFPTWVYSKFSEGFYFANLIGETFCFDLVVFIQIFNFTSIEFVSYVIPPRGSRHLWYFRNSNCYIDFKTMSFIS